MSEALQHPAEILDLVDAPPLVVDLDGTLSPSDTLVESFVAMVRRDPRALLGVLPALMRGRAALKSHVAVGADWTAEDLPLRADLLDYLCDQHRRGRRLLLATAAHRLVAESVARRVGLFETVLATDGTRNLKGTAKLAAIRAAVGDRFVYAGDSRADLPVWQGSSGAVLVGVEAGVSGRVRRSVPVEREFAPIETRGRDWLKALRVHQWLKNLLILVPLITTDAAVVGGQIAALMVAFLAFSLLASATYIANDLWDLPHDRMHPRKRERALAAGRLSIARAVQAAVVCAGAAIGLAFTVSPAFAFVLLSYFVLTTAYSVVFKGYVLLDVLGLAMLYTIRILAGSVVLGVVTTPWLLAFSAFLFFSLALVKRCSELVAMKREGRDRTSGRDYRVEDLTVLWPLGVSAAMCSVVVMGLFISLPSTQQRYVSPDLLWLVALVLTYWLARLWIKTARGEMHDDPVVFAVIDRGGRLTLVAMVACTLLARFWGTPG